MLKSFVSEEDYEKLVEIVCKIRDNKFDDVSVLEIYGEPNSGKTTFLEVLRMLSNCDQTYLDSRLGTYRKYYSDPQNHLQVFEKHVTVCWHVDTNVLETLTKYHSMINKSLQYRRLYEFNMNIVEKPATLIVETNAKYEIPIDKQNRRFPMYLHFPNRFDCKTSFKDIVVRCVKEVRNL